jgi:hypothetical protein
MNPQGIICFVDTHPDGIEKLSVLEVAGYAEGKAVGIDYADG